MASRQRSDPRPGALSVADLHVHTVFSKDVRDAKLTPPNIVRRAKEAGLPAVGFADHYHPGHNAPEADELRELRSFVDSRDVPLRVYLGIEASILDRAGATTVDDEEPGRFDYVIASMHPHFPRVEQLPVSSAAAFIDFLQGMYLNVLANPCVHVVGHPWNLHAKSTGDNSRSFWGACRALGLSPAACFDMIPDSYFEEFGRAARRAGKAVELNAYGMATRELGSLYDEDGAERLAFGESYLRLYRILSRQGVLFTAGSDAHSLRQVGDTVVLGRYFADLGIGAERLWLPRDRQEETR